jgi:predicted GNAT superfamily acetyltransferase
MFFCDHYVDFFYIYKEVEAGRMKGMDKYKRWERNTKENEQIIPV